MINSDLTARTKVTDSYCYFDRIQKHKKQDALLLIVLEMLGDRFLSI